MFTGTRGYKLILIVVILSTLLSYSQAYFNGKSKQHVGISNRFTRSVFNKLPMMMTETPFEVKPGSPKVIEVNKELNTAKIMLSIDGDLTQKSFSKSLELYNEEVVRRNLKIPGFRKGAKLPSMYLYQIFGEEQVKGLCASLLAKEIQTECEKTGLSTVGRGNILNFNTKDFSAGKSHQIEVEVELWPEITYTGPNGYKGLKVTVAKEEFDVEKYEQVKKSIQERYRDLISTETGYIACAGDVAVVNMNGFDINPDGSKGAALPAVAQGSDVEVPLEPGKFMEGLVEGLIGAKAGDTREIKVKFPRRPTGAGATLSGKEAIFEIQVLAVKQKKLAPWTQELATKIRDGMTLEELDNEVRSAVDTEKSKAVESKRNDALAAALVESAVFNRVPESLVEENTQTRFQNMLMDFKEQGSTEDQIKEMATPENYNRYKEISRANTEKVVKLGLLFRDIAEKESIKVSEEEIKAQLDLLFAQAKQKNQAMPDEEQARDEIENTLLRLKIFDFLASMAEITYTDTPKETK